MSEHKQGPNHLASIRAMIDAPPIHAFARDLIGKSVSAGEGAVEYVANWAKFFRDSGIDTAMYLSFITEFPDVQPTCCPTGMVNAIVIVASAWVGAPIDWSQLTDDPDPKAIEPFIEWARTFPEQYGVAVIATKDNATGTVTLDNPEVIAKIGDDGKRAEFEAAVSAGMAELAQSKPRAVNLTERVLDRVAQKIADAIVGAAVERAVAETQADEGGAPMARPKDPSGEVN